MKMTVWMAQNKKGEFLCWGNMNAYLSYHLCCPYDCGYLRGERWLMYRTKWEIEAHIKKWHSELDADAVKKDAVKNGLGSLAKIARCRPVKMVVSWEPATKGVK